MALAKRLILPVGLWICLNFTGCGRPAGQDNASGEPKAVQQDIFGKIIHFDGSYEAEPFKVSGWSATEKNFTWTMGKAAVLALPVPPNSGALRLRMLASAYAHPPQINSQPVEVYANGQKITDWDVTSAVWNSADIPQEIANKSATLTVQLRIPKAASPAEFSATGDERVLGICCHEMKLTKVPPP
jgi:hypothetical protein